MTLREELKNRNLPPIFETEEEKKDWKKVRKRLLKIMMEDMYGVTLPSPKKVEGKVISEETTCAGKVLHQKIELSFDTPKGEFSFLMNIPCRHTFLTNRA